MTHEGAGIAPAVQEVHPMTTGEMMALEAQNRAEVDIQIATAKRYPRTVSESLAVAEELITENTEVAAGMFYKLPRGGRMVEGPSIRLAEVLVYAWKNTRSGARLIGQSNKDVTIQSSFMDLERNNGVIKEVRRRILNKDGEPYNEDMILTTINAGAAIAWRNGVFAVIPRVYANRLMGLAKQCAIGDATTLVERRTKLVDAFIKFGLMEVDLLKHLDVKSVADIDLDALEHMTGIFTALRDKQTTVEAIIETNRWGEVDEKATPKRRPRKKTPNDLSEATKDMKDQRESEPAKEPAKTGRKNAGPPAAESSKAKPKAKAKSQPRSRRAPEPSETTPKSEPAQESNGEPPFEGGKEMPPDTRPDPTPPDGDALPGEDLFPD